MDEDKLTVRGEPDVALDAVGPRGEPEVVGGHGVFGGKGTRAAMGDDEGTHGSIVVLCAAGTHIPAGSSVG